MGSRKDGCVPLAVRGVAEGMEDSAEALSPWVGKRPQRWSRTQALG